MPKTAQHKAQSREQILNSAAKLFCHQGFHATSIDDVMRHCGLTRGAFYAHFDNKASLYQHAIGTAARNRIALYPQIGSIAPQDWIRLLINKYASAAHVSDGTPCPLAFLVNDINMVDVSAKLAYNRTFETACLKVKSQVEQYFPEVTLQQVSAAFTLMIGAVAIGRSFCDLELLESYMAGIRQQAATLLAIEL